MSAENIECKQALITITEISVDHGLQGLDDQQEQILLNFLRQYKNENKETLYIQSGLSCFYNNQQRIVFTRDIVLIWSHKRRSYLLGVMKSSEQDIRRGASANYKKLVNMIQLSKDGKKLTEKTTTNKSNARGVLTLYASARESTEEFLNATGRRVEIANFLDAVDSSRTYATKIAGLSQTKKTAHIPCRHLGDLTLADYLKSRQFQELGLIERVRLAIMLLQSYQLFTKYKIVHRDIKPSNMMLQQDGDGNVVKLTIIDFGFSFIEDLKGKKHVGTLAFVDPFYYFAEGDNEKRQADNKTDCFSLGLIMLIFFDDKTLHVDRTTSNNKETIKILFRKRIKFCNELAKWRQQWANEQAFLESVFHQLPAIEMKRYKNDIKEKVYHDVFNSMHLLMQERRIERNLEMAIQQLQRLSIYLCRIDAVSEPSTVCSSTAASSTSLLAASSFWHHSGSKSSEFLVSCSSNIIIPPSPTRVFSQS